MAAALHYCVREGRLVSAPVVVLLERGAARDRYLDRSEVARLLRAARKSDKARLHLPLYILLGVYCGTRRNALTALQWQPNTAGGWTTWTGVIDFQGGERRTKQKRSLVPIPRRLRVFLELARKRTRQYVVEYNGQPIVDPKRALATAGRVAGLGHVHSHLLRHTAVTWLVQDGVPLWEVGRWVGMTSDMIERVYGHHSPDRFKNAAGRTAEAVDRWHVAGC